MTVTATSRRIDCTGAFNLRDLGGYQSQDGRTLRWRTIFRADGLHRVTADSVAVLRQLGWRTVLDLRTPAEVEAGQYRCDGTEVIHLPLLRQTWDRSALATDPADAADFLACRYLEMSDQGRAAIAAAFEVLAAGRRLPSVFHCSAGKDRTGVLAALVLAALGVDDDQIAEDYQLSATAMDRLIEWITARRPDAAEHMARQPAALMSCPPEAIRRFLHALRHRHGAIELYLAEIGVDRYTLELVRDNLLVG